MNEQLHLFEERVSICVEFGVAEQRAVEIAYEQIRRMSGFPSRAQVQAGFDMGFGLKKTIRTFFGG